MLFNFVLSLAMMLFFTLGVAIERFYIHPTHLEKSGYQADCDCSEELKVANDMFDAATEAQRLAKICIEGEEYRKKLDHINEYCSCNCKPPPWR